MAFNKHALHVATRSIPIDISSTDHTLTTPSTGFWVGGGGTLIIQLSGDTANSTWTISQAGFLPVSVKKVVKTGTTVTAEMKALYPM